MISVEKVSFGYPEKDLYHKISFCIERGEHCVLIGSNGTGKSTLTDMLLQPDEYLFEGKIKKEQVGRVGFVSQLLQREKQRDITVYDYLAEPFLAMQQEMEATCARMVEQPDCPEIFDEYQAQMDAFDAIDGYNYDTNIHKELKMAALTHTADLKLEALSGGEYKLVQIIHEMLIIPDLLVLDEPDVFLDFENLNGLVKLINSYAGTLLVVTHSRYLLYHCFNKILHLENMDVQEFEGTYAEYNVALLEAKVDQTEQSFKDQEEIDRQNAVVTKMRNDASAIASARKGRSLKARVSYLNRLMARRTTAPFVDIPRPKITLPVLTGQEPADHAADAAPLLRVQDYCIAFDEILLERVSFDLQPGEKIAIVGPNGTGKTTLLRSIYSGTENGICISPDARIGFLSQLYSDMLDERRSVREEVEGLCDSPAEAEALLADYYFTGLSLEKTVGSLSGGEKNLLQLAKISRSDANVLLLDEPTSHLDTYAQMALEQAVINYKGAVLMVSHDFYTISNCADTVLYVEDRTIRRMSGRAFRKMIYKQYFEKDYLEMDQKRKQLEVKIHQLLKEHDFKKAAQILEQYEGLLI